LPVKLIAIDTSTPMSEKDRSPEDESPRKAVVVDDMDAEKRVHKPSYRSERRLAAQKQALELAVSGATIGVVLSPVAEETRKQVTGDARVALYIVDPDGARLRFGAAAGMQHYTSAVDGFEIRPTNQACGRVAFTGERIIVEDVTTDPLWEPYRALAQQHRIRGCWSFPIRSVADKILVRRQSARQAPPIAHRRPPDGARRHGRGDRHPMTWQLLARDPAIWWCRRFHRRHHDEKTYGPYVREITCRRCKLRWPVMNWPRRRFCGRNGAQDW